MIIEIDDELHQRVRLRAKRNRRSMKSEVAFIVENSLSTSENREVEEEDKTPENWEIQKALETGNTEFLNNLKN